MVVLAFTSSTDHGSVALTKNGRLVSEKTWMRKAQQGEALTGHIKKVMTAAKIKFQDIDLIAVDKGPGSFTGCRMAVNAAKTLSYGLGCPIFALPSLDIVAFQCASQHEGPMWCVLNAHKALLYGKKYLSDGNNEVYGERPITALKPEDILDTLDEDTLVVGDLPLDFEKMLKSKNPQRLKILKWNYPQASTLNRMALTADAKTYKTWIEVEPSYIRSPL